MFGKITHIFLKVEDFTNCLENIWVISKKYNIYIEFSINEK